MSVYIYKARDAKGELVSGEMEGKSPSIIKHKLVDMGLLPTNVQSKGVSFDLDRFFPKKKKVDAKELIALTRQFAALFKAGVPMDRIITTLSRQTTNEGLRDALKKIGEDVSSGKSLSEAFGRHPKYFDQLYVNMLAVGELAGVLDATLLELTNVMKREHRIVSGVKSATLYPKIVIVAFTAVVFLMMGYVIPAFADFYGSYGAELPLATRIMIKISDTVVAYWYYVLIAAVIAFFSFRKYLSTANGRRKFDNFKYKIPVFGKLDLMVANARFCHLLSTLYKSGLSLSRALPIIGNTIGNVAFQEEIDRIYESVERGSGLSASMEKEKHFTPLVIETTAVGEDAGSLDEMLQETADFYDEEITDMLDRLTTLIEPLLLVGIFAMVALLAMAVFQPMWNVTRVLLPQQ